jgi:AcrR family transcriptional regulator
MTDNDRCGFKKPDGEPCQLPASQPDECCHHHTDHDPMRGGRPSKFDDCREDILDAARDPIKTRDVARTAGVGKSTLYDWLDEHDNFSDAFRRARSQAARGLVKRGLDDPDTDTRMVTFLLERTFDYIKTERREVDGELDLGDVTVDFTE